MVAAVTPSGRDTDGLAGWLASWPVMVCVVEMGGVSQPGADAKQYRCALAGSTSTGGFLVQYNLQNITCFWGLVWGLVPRPTIDLPLERNWTPVGDFNPKTP